MLPFGEISEAKNAKSAASWAALFDFSLLYLLSQVGGGKPEKIMTLFLLGNVWIGGKSGWLGGLTGILRVRGSQVWDLGLGESGRQESGDWGCGIPL
jgi:hypothetical protein